MESVEYATNVDIRVHGIYVDSKFLSTSKLITLQGPMHQLLVQLCQSADSLGLRLGQRFDDHRLAATCRTDHHRRVTRHHRLVQLHHLVHLNRYTHTWCNDENLIPVATYFVSTILKTNLKTHDFVLCKRDVRALTWCASMM